MRFLRIVIVAGTCLGGAVSAASAAPARFWISDSKFDPTVPEAPTINAAVGQPRKLYIWAQPATDGNGDFRTLDSFSLDIVTQQAPMVPQPQPFIDFLNGTFKVYNDPVPVIDKERFQFITDSYRIEDEGGPLLSEKSATQVMSGQPDAILGLQGLSLLTADVVGIGHIDDPHRVVTNGPAWRVAEFSFKALQPSGMNSLFLQIGFTGMVHQGVGGTDVLFGTNSTPIYNAALTSHRQKNLSGDTYEVQINAVEFTPGDYNGDGDIGAEDYDNWRSSFGQSVAAGEGADGNGDGVVDTADYLVWRKRMALGSAASSTHDHSQPIVVPEPGTHMLISILVGVILFSKRVARRG